MPSKKKKYNARFPAGRIKKIMQTDEEVGKVAQAVPVIISRTLELFVESLLTKSMQITQSRNAKTLTPSHMKQCILSESRFDFLKDLVKNIPDASVQEDNENNAAAVETPEATTVRKEPEKKETSERRHSKPETELAASFYLEQQSTSTSRTPSVIQYVPKLKTPPTESVTPRLNFSVESLVKQQQENKLQVDVTNIPPLVPALPANNQNSSCSSSSSSSSSSNVAVSSTVTSSPANRLPSEDNLPQLIPISHNFYAQNNSGDNLYIDEDYDN